MSRLTMKRYSASPEALSRFKTVCTLVIGACILLLLNTLVDLFVVGNVSAGHAARFELTITGLQLLLIVATLVVAFRFVRYTKLPGIPALFALMAVMWGMVLLSHFGG